MTASLRTSDLPTSLQPTSNMRLPYTTLDVFTSTPYSGNPLAIVSLPSDSTLTQSQKQLIAREFNFSETVFLHAQTHEDLSTGAVRINIFTPVAELPFAGHPTVGTGVHLLRDLRLEGVKALETKAGRVPIQLGEDGESAGVEVAHDVHLHDEPFVGTAYGHYPVFSIVRGMNFILAQMGDLEELGEQSETLVGVKNSFEVYGKLDEGWREGMVGTYFYVDQGYDSEGVRLLRTRMLAWIEDPATGSAASALCAYLALSEKQAERTRKYKITQGEEMGRPSTILVEVTLNADGEKLEKVVLSGTAVYVMEGTIVVPQ